jgi:ribosomal protein S27AE
MKRYLVEDFEKETGMQKRTLQRLAKQGIIGKKYGRQYEFTDADIKKIEKQGLKRGAGNPGKEGSKERRDLVIKTGNIVAKALRHGEIKKEPCRDCGEIKTQAHHEDYNMPLKIIWLCRKCHLKRHKNK